MRKNSIWIGVVLLLAPGSGLAASPFSRLLEPVCVGNRLFQKQRFEQALNCYEQAMHLLEREPRIHFNRGGALFKLRRFKQAREAFLRASGSDDPDLRKRNYYNIGNTFLAEGAFRDAAAFYRRALEIDPQYDHARFNLEIALRALKHKQQPRQHGADRADQPSRPTGGSQPDEHERLEQHQGGFERENKQPKTQDQQSVGRQQDQNWQQQDLGATVPSSQQQPKHQHSAGQPESGEDTSSGRPDPAPRQQHGRLSKAQIHDLLDAMRESERPFQMSRFLASQFEQRALEKDW